MRTLFAFLLVDPGTRRVLRISSTSIRFSLRLVCYILHHHMRFLWKVESFDR